MNAGSMTTTTRASQVQNSRVYIVSVTAELIRFLGSPAAWSCKALGGAMHRFDCMYVYTAYIPIFEYDIVVIDVYV